MLNKFTIVLISSIIAFSPALASAASPYAGKILLQTEANDAVWYVSPSTGYRTSVPAAAAISDLLGEVGVSISNGNLKQIPIGLLNSYGADDDNDGLSNALEAAIGANPNKEDSDGDGFGDYDEVFNGYNPLGPGKMAANQSIANSNKGKILLRSDKRSEAWYVYPGDAKRYFLDGNDNAFDSFQLLGLGVYDSALAKIPINIPKANYALAGWFSLRYPREWGLNENANSAPSYNGLSIIQGVKLLSNSGSATIEFDALESDQAYGVNDFKKSAGQNGAKTSEKTLLVGVKPALQQKFLYKGMVKNNNIQFHNGIVVLTDIMINKNKFIHVNFTVPEGADIAKSEPVFNQIIKEIRLANNAN
ncbi:MAG: thrombospondin type 3 repeat-containing protein [Parcubacteria group bacterium]